jgi:hypothetical protein
MDTRQGNSMNRRFLFRLDGSKDNDNFFACRRQQEDAVAYSGTAMPVGPGWIPDLIAVEAVDDGADYSVTLIELEASEIVARASCRKYLPESSTDIVQRFVAYLDSIMAQCQGTADPRLDAFRSLREALANQETVVVRTAGALRSSADYLEVHTLLDQPERISLKPSQPAVAEQVLAFGGTQSFSREETDGLRRTVRILHTVVTGHDHSNCTVHSWRNLRRKPLDIAVAKDRARFAQLDQLLGNKSASGMRLDCDRLVEELVDLWSTCSSHHLKVPEVADSVRRFVPVSMRFANQESMRAVYEAARSVLNTHAI